MIKFGTGGFRAIIGDQFTRENIVKIALGIVRVIEEDNLQKKVIIGYDRRFLSKEAALWVSKVLVDAEIKVLFINKSTPTPMIMFGVEDEGIDMGVAITASHNPALYNGIKLFEKGGVDASVTFTNRIELYANEAAFYDFNASDFEAIIHNEYFEYYDNYNNYINSILEQVDLQSIQKSRIKVGLDPLYGVSERALQTLLNTVRCDLSVINEGHDTLFGRQMPAPTEETVTQLQSFVLQHQLDIGIATDGDADRIGIVDNNGRFLHPNDILMIIYYYQLEYQGKTGPVVRNISTTHTLDKIAHAYNQEVYEVPVGFKNISQKMLETDALLGGESSGGLTIRGHISGKDGIYASMVIIEILAKTGKTISEFYDEVVERFGKTQTIEKQFHLTDELKSLLIKTINTKDFLPLVGFTMTFLSDGIKYKNDKQWILVRLSGTEPVLRIVGESPLDMNLEEEMNKIAKSLGL